MKIGFTGTQVGMTEAQKKRVRQLLKELNPDEIHAGDCVGADAEFVQIARELKPEIRTVGHVPDNDSKRARLSYSEQRDALPYLERNKKIVESSEILIATPKEKFQVVRSGTWSTVRYAYRRRFQVESQAITVYIVFPDGEVSKPFN